MLVGRQELAIHLTYIQNLYSCPNTQIVEDYYIFYLFLVTEQGDLTKSRVISSVESHLPRQDENRNRWNIYVCLLISNCFIEDHE